MTTLELIVPAPKASEEVKQEDTLKMPSVSPPKCDGGGEVGAG